MSTIATQQRIGIILLLLVMLAASVWPAPRSIQAQTGPSAVENNGWSFVDVARVGQNGFTQLDTGRAGPDEVVVVSGVHNGQTGLFHMENDIVTAVATDGQVLPGGLGTLGDIGAFSFQYAVLPNGDVIFKARVTDGSLSPAFTYTFRWSNGTISLAQPSQEIDPETLTQAFDHDLAQATTDDRWLATLRTGPFPTTTTDYGLTNGTERPSIFSFTRGAANCIFNTLIHAAANANGVLAYYEVAQTTPQDGNRCANELGTTRTWSVKLAGAATGTIASGSSFEQVNTYTGAELSDTSNFLMNNQNQVAAVRELHNSPTTFIPRRQLVVLGAGSEQIIQDTDGPASGIFLADFDQQGRVLYSVTLDDFVTTVLLGGPDLENDRVLRTGDPLFGRTVTSLRWEARPAAAGADGARSFAFQYGLDDGSVGIALARQQRPRWTNPAGGNWGAAANWTPASVPGAGDDVRFDQAGAYAVNLGTQQVGSVAVQNGDVTFRNGALTLSGADSELGISARNAGNVARLTIAGADTVVAAPAVGVGFGGPGELRIESATLKPPDESEDALGAILGFIAPATATVTAGGFWLWPQMSLGLTHDALLRVEAGAVSGVGAKRLFVGGSPLSLQLRNQTGRVVVDNTANAGGKLDLGTLLGPLRELVIGEALIGRLEVTNGGRAIAVTTTVGTRDHGTATDGFLTVAGTNATQPARFESGGEVSGGLFVATGAGTDALVTVSAGGTMSLTQLSLADGAQSNALMFVDGMETADGGERRSTVIAPLPPVAPDPEEAGRAGVQNPDNGNCVIGRRGRGTLNVSNGALVHCRQIAVGFAAGSQGALNIDGIFRSVNARVVADGPRIEDGAICIGRVPLCGATSGVVRGEVILGADGILEGRVIGIGSGGRLRGSGIAITTDGVVVIDGGSVAPGVVQLIEQRANAATHQVGTLTIQGNLTISQTGVITVHVLGGTADLQDRLVVSGTLSLNGDLAINFGNGYAPRQGDQLALIQANAVNGAPQNVVISGLEPDFQHTLDFTGGALTLIAQNDGVPTTQTQDRSIFLPMVQRSGQW